MSDSEKEISELRAEVLSLRSRLERESLFKVPEGYRALIRNINRYQWDLVPLSVRAIDTVDGQLKKGVSGSQDSVEEMIKVMLGLTKPNFAVSNQSDPYLLEKGISPFTVEGIGALELRCFISIEKI